MKDTSLRRPVTQHYNNGRSSTPTMADTMLQQWQTQRYSNDGCNATIHARDQSNFIFFLFLT